tara:strand:- start:2726 stop:3292 length:567 start_codon:yes stop_codon:yes gene_type:complete
MKKIILVFIALFISLNINAQSTKKIAINNGISTSGMLFSGLYFTQPITEKIAISLSANYGTNISAELDVTYEVVIPARLDLSYRILDMPLNIYIGGGADLGFHGEFVGALGVSYGWKNFAFYTELLTYSQMSTLEREIETYVENGYWEYDYWTGSTWVDTGYFMYDWEEEENYNTYTALVFGLKWFFK